MLSIDAFTGDIFGWKVYCRHFICGYFARTAKPAACLCILAYHKAAHSTAKTISAGAPERIHIYTTTTKYLCRRVQVLMVLVDLAKTKNIGAATLNKLKSNSYKN